MLEPGFNLVYIPKHTVAIQLSHVKKDRLFRKELICVGKYKKYCDEGTEEDEKGKYIPFEVEEQLLNHWHRTNKLMQYNGIEVPMPKKHTDDPEFRRGTLVDTELGYNEDKKPALFGIYKYRDAQAEKDLKDADVSIYVPEKFVDVNGVEYKYPIRHVAFTDYPVIPKLGKIQPIAASYSTEEETEMKDTAFLRKLATKLGIGKEIPDDKLEAALMHIADAIMDEEDSDEEEEGEEESEGEEETDSNSEESEESEGEEEGNENVEGDDEEEDEEVKDKEEETDTLPKKKKETKAHLAREAHVKEYHPPISAAFLGILGEARITKLDRLVETNCLTPASRDKLAEEFCSKEALSLAFTTASDKPTDSFDAVVAAMEENSVEKLVQHEVSGGQEMALAFSSVNAENNVLVKNAEERRQKSKQG